MPAVSRGTLAGSLSVLYLAEPPFLVRHVTSPGCLNLAAWCIGRCMRASQTVWQTLLAVSKGTLACPRSVLCIAEPPFVARILSLLFDPGCLVHRRRLVREGSPDGVADDACIV